MKRCGKCRKLKHESNFYALGTAGYCMPCSKKYARDRYAAKKVKRILTLLTQEGM